MNLVTGPLENLGPKLLQLLQDEYKLQKNVKAEVQSLVQELEGMHVALCKVAEVPHDELDPQVKLWASDVREASYDMEDIIDTFLVRVDNGGNQTADADKAKVKRLREKIGSLFSLSKFKARREIACAIEEIKKQVEKITMRRDRYKINDRAVNSSATPTRIDPRLLPLYTKESEPIGINEPRDALIKELSWDDDATNKNVMIASIFGCGGLGKTTLAKVVYDKLAIDMTFYCKAFVPVGQNPDLRKVFRDILLELDNAYLNTNLNILDERQLKDKIQHFLKEKRFIIVMDDIWELSSWKRIRMALKDNNLRSKIIITTRCRNVAQAKDVHFSYQLKPLPHESSEKLFYGRIFGSKEKCPERLSELSQIFLKKCGGVPLAIITLSSLLANKYENINEWEVLCNAIGSGLSNNDDGVRDMRKILSLSYYDLPSHLKTCFLYLSMFPEDYCINKHDLIGMWIAEGFIQPQQGSDELFELGNTYFYELINRSLVQPVDGGPYTSEIYDCRVHDMILDLIRSLSREENFTTTLHGTEQVIPSATKQIHRLSVKDITCPKEGMSRVRSIVLFDPSIEPWSPFFSFGFLRVLAIQDYRIENDISAFYKVKLNVGVLIHLRYLCIRGDSLIWTVMEGIEKLKYLQVLCFDGVGGLVVEALLSAIFRLKQLMCVRGCRCYPCPGNQLRNFASLQVLSWLHVGENNVDALEELGHLTKLTDLVIELHMVMEPSRVHGGG